MDQSNVVISQEVVKSPMEELVAEISAAYPDIQIIPPSIDASQADIIGFMIKGKSADIVFAPKRLSLQGVLSVSAGQSGSELMANFYIFGSTGKPVGSSNLHKVEIVPSGYRRILAFTQRVSDFFG